MIVELIRNEKTKKVIGWQMRADNPEDLNTIGYIRDMHFWGFDETAIEYAGRKDGDDSKGDPGTLMWKQIGKKVKKE